MIKWLYKKLTKNYSKTPLVMITFDLNKFIRCGSDKSCDIRLHPIIKDNTFILEQLKKVVTYIREEYDMEDLCEG